MLLRAPPKREERATLLSAETKVKADDWREKSTESKTKLPLPMGLPGFKQIRRVLHPRKNMLLKSQPLRIKAKNLQPGNLKTRSHRKRSTGKISMDFK
jgi:hypothetical protein